jgi:23S rRNA (adenine2503-C2)-methyltransferase
MTSEATFSDVQLLGMTLAQYATAMGTHAQAARPRYRDLMRRGKDLQLPAPTRLQEDEGTVKFCLPAGQRDPTAPALEAESVIIPMKNYGGRVWHTLCISSQVGCRMGCTFCETGRMGLLRNLTAGEIVRQRLVARHLMWQRHGNPDVSRYFSDGIQNIVFMGMGEPLDNFDEVTQAIRVLNEPAGFDFPHAQITVSTVGRIDGIRKLAALNWPNLRLAISLNAANDTLRDQIMPINKGMPLAELQRTLLDYPLAKKGRFLIEYVLLKGVNDSPADADAVAQWCKPLPCIVNLIPYNPQRNATFETPDEERIGAFLFRLKDQGIFVKRRVTHGRDLMGACGQLGNPTIRRRTVPV